ncbi:hypothetical protein EWM64_g3020 [Hericium alpestre]|uniref:Integrase zinc-binding domain-containing protein n=1 Tax=Hericium alpestre TaxID=135208 RepID=A0A4Z0A418_9AGAM|nr:hypothetical protein EWM64_g3020 [Hericium alpestre]
MDAAAASKLEAQARTQPAEVFVAFSIEDCLDTPSIFITTRAGARKATHLNEPSQRPKSPSPSPEPSLALPADSATPSAPAADAPAEVTSSAQRSYPLLHLPSDLLTEFCEAYALDPAFQSKWSAPPSPFLDHQLGQCFFKDERDLLFFEDADQSLCLCVPKHLQPRFLELAHCSAGETAHASTEKLRAFLARKLYWLRMNSDIERYCTSCDICQKTKARNFKKYGLLLPNPIPN